MRKARIQVIDDDPAILAAVSEYMELEGHSVSRAPDFKTAYHTLQSSVPDIVITDYQLPDGDALQFLSTLKNTHLPTRCIVLTGYGTIDLAVKAIKEGAEQFITKPVEFAVLGAYVRTCLQNQQNSRKQLAHRLRIPRYDKNPFQGTSTLIHQLEEEIHRFVHTERPILIQGETGTGKGVLAAWIHQKGPRTEETLVDINCAGLSKELLESELFGYEKGAFTGASGSKQGLIEAAHRGILLLDEVGEMDLLVQPKLLGVLENNRFRRLGDVRERIADIQIIATTNRNLMQSVREMKFREDLYFRMSTFQVRIPPLRERTEDILPLANSLLQSLANDLARDKQELTSAAQTALKAYSWPGNIRELRNVLERVALTCESQLIRPEDLGLAHRAQGVSQGASQTGTTLEELEREYISSILKEEKGKVSQAATRLGIPRSTLYQKIKVYGIAIENNH
ncbi:MAG TPA: sigma-54 dependent transcriptional regulator [Candidatus Angelobacter sp.]|nr:sigma-54 dependent transcriptional regulator [Candidatus Angelobacter sp.]